MIISMILARIFDILGFMANTLPDIIFSNDTFDITSLLSLISKAFIIFPFDLFKFCISNITFWLSLQLGWAIIEWCYRKIPGVS